MKKFKVFLVSLLLLSATLTSILAVNMLRAQTSTQVSAASRDPLFSYTAKWICNTPSVQSGFNGTVVNTGDAENIGLVPAEYKTDINVHNPGPGNISILKKFVLSLPESAVQLKPGPTAFIQTLAGPDVAFFITCDEIQKVLNLPPLHAFKGFVILLTSVSTLDVVAEYSSEAFDFSPECPSPSFPPFASINCPEGLTLDVEKISAVSTKAPALPNLLFPNCALPPATNGAATCLGNRPGFIDVVVQNNGPAPSGPTLVRASGELIAPDQPILGLAPGATATVSYSISQCTFTPGPDCNFSLTVDPTNLVAESNEGDNTINAVIVG